MFSPPLNLAGKTESDVFDLVYALFRRDFVEQDTLLANAIYVDPKGQGMRDGREEVFWHITTREKRFQIRQGNKMLPVKERPLDPARASRIEWVRPMLTSHDRADIKLFYRKESRGKRPIRLYLWAHQHDFVVIVQKLGRNTSFLVSSFYITESYKRKSYNKWFAEYDGGTKPELRGCEWF